MHQHPPGLVIEDVQFGHAAVQSLLSDWNDELVAVFPGFTPTGGSVVTSTEFEPPAGIFLLALSDETPVGCGGLRRISPGTSEIKRLYVSPAARGRGIGAAVLDRLEAHARDLAVETIQLDTAGDQPAALALFRAAGYQPIPDYNGNRFARYWFAKTL